MAGVYGHRSSSSYHRNDGTGEVDGNPYFMCTSKSSSYVGSSNLFQTNNQWEEESEAKAPPDEDGDLLYVKEYRELEYKKILEVNQRKSNLAVENNSKDHGDLTGGHGNKRAGKDVYKYYGMNHRLIDNHNLIINASRNEILAAVRNHQVTIIEGFTGCGKTTQVPQFLLDEAAKSGKHCKIVVTQPRRIAAVSVATRVCEERGWELGGLVGYQVGMDRLFCDDSRLVYMTTGVLLQMMINKKNFDDWTHIVIDEVHERDLDTDLLMLVIKRIMIELGDTRIRVVLMSATLNVQKFKDYFPAWSCDDLKTGAAFVCVPHQSLYPITEYYLNNIPGIEMYVKEDLSEQGAEPRIEQNVYGAAVEIIASLDAHESKGSKANIVNGVSSQGSSERGAVLVFLPGLLEIETLYKLLNDFAMEREKEHGDPKWLILPLHSTITNEEQQKVFLPAAKGCRKIILATNIAESSITVTDIKYVIDFCLTKSLSCDPVTNYTCLRLEWASKNQCIQRKGRCGRVSPGVVYRMVPKGFYDNLVQEAAPEMKKSSLESVVLHAKMLSMGSPVALLALAIDPPKKSGIRRAVANLKEVGALTIHCYEESAGTRLYNEFDGDLTYLGQIMAKLPLDMRFGRLIMMGHIYNLLDECIIIAAGLSTKSPFSYPYHRRLQAYLSKLHWSQNTFSDCFALVRVYRTWVKKFVGNDSRRSEERNWAKQYLVQLSVMREIKNLVDEIKRRLRTVQIETRVTTDADLTEERGLLLKIVIAGAFYPNYFVAHRRSTAECKEYDKNIYKDLAGRNPTTTVSLGQYPPNQPTAVYEKHILKYFDGSTFDGEMIIPYAENPPNTNKLLVSFDSRGQKVGALSHGLYRAIKMRMLRQIVSFPVLTQSQSNAYLEQYKMDSKKLDLSSVAPLPVTLPTILEREVRVIVTHAISPSEFYVVRESDLTQLAQVDKILSAHSASMKAVRFERLRRGDLVFLFEDNMYHRARIEQIVEDRQRRDALVYRIDRGGISFRKSHQLFWVKSHDADQLYQIPGLAIQCRIKEVAAPAKFANTWPSKSNVMLETLVCSCKITTFEIFSIVESIMAGDVLLPPTKHSFRRHLLETNLAEESQESRDSQENFGNRISSYVARQDKNVLDMMNAKQVTKNIPKPTIPPPECKEIHPIMTLRGPNSPLELTFTSMSRTLMSKLVMVDGASVNSVALDQEHLNPVSRLLVAGSVAISQRNDRAMARDSTMLPALPSLAGLMTLLFCPVARLCLNDSLTHYIGVLGGLGTNPHTRESAYSDHDMAVTFDTKIDSGDIKLINSIRNTMNRILRESHAADLSVLRGKAIQDTLALISKPRELIEEETFSLEWEDYPVGVVIERSQVEVDPGDVFQLHEYPKLD